jgi:DNA-binding NarL/FixJ family response regulator
MSESFAVPHALPRIMVVDDEPMMQEVFRITFDELYQIDGYVNGEEALEAILLIPYAVAIVDVKMVGMSGVQLLCELKKVSPHTQVIMLTGNACMDSAIAALNKGAFRYILKPFQVKQMKEIVASAFARHSFETDHMADVNPEALKLAGLVGRKAEVALQVAQCRSTKEIAERLNLSPRTVEKHLESVFSILQISSRRELIARIKMLISSSSFFGASFVIDAVDFMTKF